MSYSPLFTILRADLGNRIYFWLTSSPPEVTMSASDVEGDQPASRASATLDDQIHFPQTAFRNASDDEKEFHAIWLCLAARKVRNQTEKANRKD
jgi:hypothetical protein